MNKKAWVDLEQADIRRMLISLIGNRFGDHPEEHLDAIRAERVGYAEKFIKLAGVGPEDTVLDLGSGCGFGTAAISSRARQVIACDISPAYLAFAQKECEDRSNIRFVPVKSRDLSPIEDGSIDQIISMAVFIHLNLYDIYHYFQEFTRVLRPAGRVVIDFADMNRLFGILPNRQQDQQFLSHAGFYRDDPDSLGGLVQWNSARGIRGVARSSGLKFKKRRGHKLVFEKHG
jgi:SAM-dependent methyltransferase